MESTLKTTHADPEKERFPVPGLPDHVMMLDDVEYYVGDHLPSVKTILFNSNHIPPEEALRIVRAGEYSPYVLSIPKEQFYGLFKDQLVKPTNRLPNFEQESPAYESF